MASELGYVGTVCDQMSDAGRIASARCLASTRSTVAASWSRSSATTELFSEAHAWRTGVHRRARRGAPYPGAKPSFLIEDHVDDREWLPGLIEVTTRELSAPKAKRPKSK